MNCVNITGARRIIDRGINAVFFLLESFEHEQLDGYLLSCGYDFDAVGLKTMFYEYLQDITSDLLDIREKEFYASIEKGNHKRPLT
jgi:hypothetical protein